MTNCFLLRSAIEEKKKRGGNNRPRVAMIEEGNSECPVQEPKKPRIKGGGNVPKIKNTGLLMKKKNWKN